MQIHEYQKILQNMPAIIFRFVDHQGELTTEYISDYIATYGYRPEQFYNGEMNWQTLIHPKDIETAMWMMQSNLRKGVDEFRMNYRLVDSRNELTLVMQYTKVNRDEQNRVVGCDAIIISSARLQTDRKMIKDHCRQQEVMNNILMNLQEDDLDHALQSILDQAGEYLGASRVVFWKESPKEGEAEPVHTWRGSGLAGEQSPESLAEYIQHISQADPEWRQTGRALIDATQIPQGCQTWFEQHGILAAAVFAICLDREHYGLVSFEDGVTSRQWDLDTLQFLQNIVHLISTVIARKQAAHKLQQSQKVYETILDNVDYYIFVTKERSDQIIYANAEFKNAFEKDCIGKHAKEYLAIPEVPLPSGQAGQRDLVQEIFSDKTNEWLQVTSEPLRWVDGQRVRLYNCYDITAKKLYADTVEKLAFTDHLTKLPNRYRCDMDLKKAIQNAEEANKIGYLMFIDIDDFKIVNDCYGHDYGDGILKSFADHLRSNFQEPNKIFRFGGDEFVIVISHQDAHRIHDYLEALMHRTKQPWKALDKEFYCTLSIGVVKFPGKDTKTLIKHADIAMYEAKRSGKNMIRFYENSLAGGPSSEGSWSNCCAAPWKTTLPASKSDISPS